MTKKNFETGSVYADKQLSAYADKANHKVMELREAKTEVLELKREHGCLKAKLIEEVNKVKEGLEQHAQFWSDQHMKIDGLRNGDFKISKENEDLKFRYTENDNIEYNFFLNAAGKSFATSQKQSRHEEPVWRTSNENPIVSTVQEVK